MVLLATAAVGFMGCPSHVSRSSGYNGTVKVKIFNNADVPLTVSSITEYKHNDPTILGSYGEETTISVNGNKELEISCHSPCSGDACQTKINCYCTSGSSVVYPYAGYINGSSVTIYTSGSRKEKTSEYEFRHPSLKLKFSDPGTTITVVYNFVKTTGGDYVLCKVE